MNATKKLIPVKSSQGVKTRMVAMIARVEMDLKRQCQEYVQKFAPRSAVRTLIVKTGSVCAEEDSLWG